MRYLAVAAATFAIALPLQAQGKSAAHEATWSARTWLESFQAHNGPEQVEKITKTFKVGATGTLDLANISGDILVNEGGGDTITIEATKKVRARSDAAAKEQFQNCQVNFVERAGRVEVKVVYSGQKNQAWVDFVVTAPAGTNLYPHSVSGDIKVTGIKGDLRAESVSGDVTVHSAPGATLLKSVSGSVEVDGVNARDALELNSVSGDITVRNAKARQITAESVSGEVTLRDVACERATVKSISGDVVYTGSLARGGRYEMTSHSGEIRLTLPSDVGFELNARTFSGNVRSDLPVAFKANDQNRGDRGGRHSGRTNQSLQGTFGDGSAMITLSSFSGDIVVAKK